MTKPTGRPKGGFRPGSGRKPNPYRSSIIAQKILDQAAKDPTGKTQTPLDFLIQAMRCEELPYELRWKSAVAAAPFVHARLQSVQVSDPDSNRLTIVIRDFTQQTGISTQEDRVRDAIIDQTIRDQGDDG